jgi:Ca2+-binding RTX toxin-like protein
MAIYLWSALTNGQNITFDPLVDQLIFDSGITSYKDLTTWDTQNTFSSFIDKSGKAVTFTGLGIDRISLTNITFQGSVAGYYVGDLTSDVVNDPLANNITGSVSHDVLFGLGGNDTLNGADGDDLIFAAGGGNDSVDGGNGYDWYMVGTGSLYGITANMLTGKVYYYDNGEIDTITNIEGVRGSMLDDTIIGNNADNGLRGRAGNDLLAGLGGIDWAYYNETNATTGVDVDLQDEYAYNDGYGTADQLFEIENVRGGMFADYIAGGYDNNTLQGEGGNDTLVGREGNDVLRGGAGDDILFGDFEFASAGINLAPFYYNTADYGDAASAVTVNLSITSAQNTFGAGIDTLYDIQNLWGSAYNDALTGNAAANYLSGGLGNDLINGGDGDDTLDGREGNDTLNGGIGLDTATYSRELAGVVVNLSTVGAQNTVGSGTDTLTSIENLTGSAFNDSLTGSTVANRIVGGAGNDTINAGLGDDWVQGGAGNDSLIGSTGIDTVDYSDATAGVLVNLTNTTTYQNTGGGGSDRLQLFENVNGSNFNDTLTGDAGSNVINGFAGDDVIVGGAGNDTLDGGYNYYTFNPNSPNPVSAIENDTVSYAAATGGVTVSLNYFGMAQNIGGGQGLDVIQNFENVIGSSFNDTLSGNYASNRVTGGGGNDVLMPGVNGSSGTNDIVDGGAGLDTVRFDDYYSPLGINTGMAIDLNLVTAQTYATYSGTSSFTLIGIENAVGSNGADTITGTAGSNLIDGGLGDDTLIGGAGVDTLSYEFGNYYAMYDPTTLTLTGVTVSLAVTGVQNTVVGGQDTVSGFENLTGSMYNDTLTGDAAANVIDGGAGDDVMNGGLGVDTVSYGSATGSVVVNLALAGKQFTGAAGSDTLSGFERVTGSAYSDTLTGNSVANMLTGGGGSDILSGGLGADSFLFISAADSQASAGLFDVITDFNTAQADKILLNPIDANAGLAGDQAFSYIGAAAFSAAGQVRFDSVSHMLYGDINGDGIADLQIQLNNVATLASTDFIL